MKRKVLKILSQPHYPVAGLCVILILSVIPYSFNLIPDYIVIAFAFPPLLFLLASFIWGFNYMEE